MPAAASVETYRPSPAQAKFHRDPARERLMLGAWGSGKSTALVWEMLQCALEHPGATFAVFRRTFPALRDTTWKDVLSEIPQELVTGQIRTEGREEIVLHGGTRILSRALDDWRKHGSQSFDLIAIDEAWEVSEDDYRMLAKGRLRGKKGPRRAILASNPPNRDSWLYKYFEEHGKDDPNLNVHHFATYDNVRMCEDQSCTEALPVHDAKTGEVRYTHFHSNLPPGYIAELEKMPESWRRRFLLGQWGFLVEGEPVYQEFNESTHVADLQFVPGVKLLRGFDPGFRHPACIWAQVLPSGHAIILHELMGTNEDYEIFVRRVLEETRLKFPLAKPEEIEDFCDVAGKQDHGLGTTAHKIMRDHGITPMFRKLDLWKSITSIRYLIRTWHMQKPLLRVNRPCRLMTEAFCGGYAMDKDQKKNGVEVPKKDAFYDNVADAARFALAPAAMPLASNWIGKSLPARPRVAV